MPASDFSTSNREYFLTLPECEEDELLIEAMTGHEGVSQLFNFSLQLLSGQDAIDPRKIIAPARAMQAYQVKLGSLEKELPFDGLFETQFYERALKATG